MILRSRRSSGPESAGDNAFFPWCAAVLFPDTKPADLLSPRQAGNGWIGYFAACALRIRPIHRLAGIRVRLQILYSGIFIKKAWHGPSVMRHILLTVLIKMLPPTVFQLTMHCLEEGTAFLPLYCKLIQH